MSKAVIFLNGELNNFSCLQSYLRETSLYIAADGGARHAALYDLPLHYIMGDLDSITKDTLDHFQSRGTQVIRYPAEKDFTDLEICLNFAKEQGATEVHLVGVEGGRCDHIFSTFTIFAHQEFCALKLWAYDSAHRITKVQGGEQLALNTAPGSRLSLIPLTATVCGVSVSGTRWELSDATLHIGRSLSVSNVALQTSVNITIQQGIVVVISEHQLPSTPAL